MSVSLEQVGTSSVVYPAAGFAPMLASRGVPVAEFNLEDTQVTGDLMLAFLTDTPTHYHHHVGTWLS